MQKPYCLESETFSLVYPNEISVRAKVQKAIRDKVIVMTATTPQEFDREYDGWIQEYISEARTEYYALREEFENALKEKYGGFDKYMEHKHGFGHYNAAIRAKIHRAAYERGHSGGESEMDNCYPDIVQFVDDIVEAAKD